MGITLAQNFYKETLSVACAAGAVTMYVSAKPTISEGYLVLSPNNASLREIVKFTAVGTDGTGDYVTILAANRGLGGTTDQAHEVSELVLMNVTAEHIQELSDAIDQVVAGSAQDASASTKGIAKLNVNPASPTEPIAVGYNDTTKLPTTTEKSALAGEGTPSATNLFRTKSTTRVAGATIAGATLPVPVYQNDTDNEFYACDANDTAAMKYLGFAVTDGVDAGDFEVQFSGIVTGFSGLSEGEKYYVQDAAGTIDTTIGTYEILAGVAISETELLIQKGSRRAAGIGDALGTASGTQVIVCGFRPSVIKLDGLQASSTHMSIMNAVWVNGAMTASNSKRNEGGVTLEGNTARLYGSGTDYMEFTITSVTDTGFTITWTESGTFPSAGNGTFNWSAEGEL